MSALLFSSMKMNNDSTLTKVYDTYEVLFKKNADPRVENWYLFGHPFGFIVIASIYLYLVCIGLPNYMKNRKPYNITTLIQLYNCYQVLACAAIIYGMISAGWTLGYTLKPMDYSDTPKNLRILNLCWYNFLLKLADLVETIFFILRKKQSQVTILHLYHHVTSLFFAWLSPKYIGGAGPTFTIILNNSVHVVMYTYYFLSTFGSSMRQKLTIIKSKLTMIQMVQFWMLVIHTAVLLNTTGHKRISYMLGYIYVVNIIINFCFFLNFYMQSYKKKKAE